MFWSIVSLQSHLWEPRAGTVSGMLLEETETLQWICWESNRCHIFIFMLKNYFHIRPCTYTTPIQVFWNFNDSLRGRVCVQTLVHFFFSFCLFLFVFVGWLAAIHVCCYVNLVFKTIYNMSTLNQRLISWQILWPSTLLLEFNRFRISNEGERGDTIDINHERITLYPIWYQKHATGFQ